MKERVTESHRRLLEGQKVRERDPSRQVSTLEPQRISYGSLAAAAVIALVLVVSAVVFTGPAVKPVSPELPIAEGEAAVMATGAVEVLQPGGEWVEREGFFTLKEGSTVRTPDGVRAEVAFGGENLLRLNYASEASLPVINEDNIAVELRSGEGYFRAREGISYSASAGGLQARTRGTVFDMIITGQVPELLALQREVEASSIGEDAGSSMLVEGTMLSLPEQFGEEGLSGHIRDIPQERLQEEWLIWNRDIDLSRGWGVGVLSSVEPQPVQIPDISSLGGEEGEEDGEQDEDGEQEEDGEQMPDITLQAGLLQEGVALNWEISGGNAPGFSLLRAEGREPTYPRDVLTSLPSSSSQFLDQQVVEGQSYTYRVAVAGEEEVAYSNAVTVAIPEKEPVIQLGAHLVDGGMGMPAVELNWHVEGGVAPDTYVLVRSEMNQQPVFPPTGSMVRYDLPPAGPDYSFVDRDVYTGYTYNYRVFAVKGGGILVESHTVSIFVDTAAILPPKQ
jgi:hypothetical protein